MSEKNLRVMTFNLLTSTKKRRSHPWRLRKRNIARIFSELRPDVVGTQEANFKQLRELAELLPDYEFIGEGNLGRNKAHSDSNWYCATFYRRDRVRPVDHAGTGDTHWLSPTPEVPASQYPLGTRPRLVTWNTFELIGSGRQFVFGTTHLEAINSWHRKKSARQLREYISSKVSMLGPDIPVFLTGDFNACAKSPEIKAMGDEFGNLEPMYDAWAEGCDGNCDDGATFRGLGLRDKVGHRLLGPRRIDYVFFRPRLSVRSVSRIDFASMEHRENALPSDHYPVLAEFSLAG
ncbi:MAG: endonuclease/exonuclease/phosphatase family protein [Candidatus Krumholzibacteriota bacterium]